MWQIDYLRTDIRTTNNSPQYFISISHNRCRCISRYLCFPVRSTLGWFCCCSYLACERAVREGIHDNKSCAWTRWKEYCLSVGCQVIFMNSLSNQERILLLGAFAMAVRSGRFSNSRFNTLAEGTVRDTISNMVQYLWLPGRQNPTEDADNELSIPLSR